MARPDTWMPIKIEPWTKKTARLNPAERGAYMDLLLAYWVGGPLPADDEETLKRLARCTDKEWKAVRLKVLAYFTRDGDVLRQGRADEELAEAAARYERRASAGRAGGQAKAKQAPQQNPSIATAPSVAEHQASYNLHSPDGETDANASVARPRKPRRTRLASDWQPNPESYELARELGLEHSEIAADIADFVAYWTGGDPRDPLKSDWERTYRNHIRDYANKIIARRARGQQPGHHRSNVGSVVDVVTRLKARADLGGSGRRDERMGRGGDGVSPAGNDDAGKAGESGGDGGVVIEADDAERMYRAARGVEASDGPAHGGSREPGSPTDAVREEDGGLPGRRGAASADDTAEHEQMVAVVGGAEGEIGPVLAAASPASGGLEEWETIPDFLRRA